jgi:hypothetical protein
MLSETGAACVAIVNSAFKNCNKRIPQHTQQNCMTDFKLSEPNEDFLFYLDNASCLELLTIVNSAFAKVPVFETKSIPSAFVHYASIWLREIVLKTPNSVIKRHYSSGCLHGLSSIHQTGGNRLDDSQYCPQAIQ